MAEPTLYLFDGHNLFHAGTFDDLRQLRDELASFVALKGARGFLVFDGSGKDESYGPLEVRYAKHADTLLERLAAEHRGSEVVCLVSSDTAVRGTSGQEVQKRSSATFLGDLQEVTHSEDRPKRLGDRLEPGTRATLEKMRRADFTTVERDEVAVLYIGQQGPPAEVAPRVWERLQSAVPDFASRRCYGVFYPTASEYRACIEIGDFAEDAKFGLESAVLPGGTFLRARLRGEPSEIYRQIGPTFDALSKAAEPDLDRPSLEYYRRPGEVDVLLPIR
jgi:predicted RNA-binding protein with PIN domain/DNA gyrase inhibitor GyrI